VKDFDRLDICVANAGIAVHMDALDMTQEQWRNVQSVNVDGAFYTAQAAARYFKSSGIFGSIIFTASVSAQLVNLPQKQACYNASKAAVVQLSRSLAVELIDVARVNSVSPGYIESEMIAPGFVPQEWLDFWLNQIPAKRFASADELKGLYVFLASDASSYMTGSDVVVDGAFTCV